MHGFQWQDLLAIFFIHILCKKQYTLFPIICAGTKIPVHNPTATDFYIIEYFNMFGAKGTIYFKGILLKQERGLNKFL